MPTLLLVRSITPVHHGITCTNVANMVVCITCTHTMCIFSAILLYDLKVVDAFFFFYLFSPTGLVYFHSTKCWLHSHFWPKLQHVLRLLWLLRYLPFSLIESLPAWKHNVATSCLTQTTGEKYRDELFDYK